MARAHARILALLHTNISDIARRAGLNLITVGNLLGAEYSRNVTRSHRRSIVLLVDAIVTLYRENRHLIEESDRPLVRSLIEKAARYMIHERPDHREHRCINNAIKQRRQRRLRRTKMQAALVQDVDNILKGLK